MDGGGPVRERVRERLVPPAPTPPADDLSIWDLWRRLPQSTEACWPARAYGDMVVHRRFFGVDHYVLNDPGAARQLLLGRSGRYTRSVGMRRIMRPGIGRGLLLAEGENWRRQRARLAGAFTPDHVDGLLPHIRDAALGLVGRVSADRPCNLHGLLEETAMDSFGRAMFSLPLGDRADRVLQLVKSYFGAQGRPRLTDLLARRESDFGWAQLDRAVWSRRWFAEIEDIIAARRAAPLQPGSRPDVLELLFRARDEDGRPLSDQEVRDEAASTMAAGFETTSRLLMWAVYLLSRDLREQAAVGKELDRTTPERVGRLADLEAWPRLRNVLLETLRLYPPVPLLQRTAHEPDEIGGIIVKPGDVLVVAPWLMHRHQRWWDRPEAFMPERFAEMTPALRKEGPYMPFGVGRRVCVGAAFAMAEASLILAELLSRYEVVLDDPRPVMPVGMVLTPSIEPRFRLVARGGGA